jgi:hypothetical protein
MTLDERAEATAVFGFTPRQARFLVTVALHSGFCLRRQYEAFAGIQYGKNVGRHSLAAADERPTAGPPPLTTARGFVDDWRARLCVPRSGQRVN